jgi:UDP-arabinose 4-epimerase
MRGSVLVTGGAGYVGSHACQALAGAGFVPIAYDDLSTGNPWAVCWGPLERGDIRDRGRLEQVMRAARPIAAMHFAAVALVGESAIEPALYYDVNVAGTVSLMAACRRAGVRHVVFSSSCSAYGIPERLPVAESEALRPISPYGASKQMAERVIADCAAAFGMRFATLRYFNVAGADPSAEIGERRSVETHLIPLTLDAIRRVRPPLKVLGTDYPTPDGTAIRDYVHVVDLAEAHVAALRALLEGEPALTLNLGAGHGRSVREVIAVAERVTGQRVPCQVGPRRPGDPPLLVADTARARMRLGIRFERSQNLEQIVADAWRWHTTSVHCRTADLPGRP